MSMDVALRSVAASGSGAPQTIANFGSIFGVQTRMQTRLVDAARV
jgi:hypothetical protein